MFIGRSINVLENQKLWEQWKSHLTFIQTENVATSGKFQDIGTRRDTERNMAEEPPRILTP
jgi:hypothetical protein